MNPTTIDEFFAGQPESRRIFDALADMAESMGPTEYAVSRSQIAFTIPPRALSASGSTKDKSRIFARVWMPDRYLGAGHAPLVLTLGFRRRDASPRWKQIVEPAPGRFTHHLELSSIEQVDGEVATWLQEARLREAENRR